MKSIIQSLNMFLLDYLIVPIWAVFSVLGNMKSGRIMIPITIVFIVINYFNTRSTTRLFLLDINLAAASMAGIILNSFLYIRFIYADPKIVADMVTLIFLYTFFIIAACVICLVIKTLIHKRNMRIINRMAEGPYDADDEYYDYEEDEEDEEDEDEEDDEEGSGFLTSITNLLRKREEEDDEESENEEEDEEDDEYEKPDGPKFRVIKK